MTVVKIQTSKKKNPDQIFFSFSTYLPKPTWFLSHTKNIVLTVTTSKTEENEQTIPVSRIKAKYEFFLFLKASRLRYPARRSTNPMPTPPANEAVLPFFIYPKTPPPTRTSPYGIVKQKSCIFANWGFSGKSQIPRKFQRSRARKCV